MPTREDMYEAHVRFELARLRDDLDQTVAAEVHELFGWLAAVCLDDVVTADQITDAALSSAQLLSGAEVPEHLAQALQTVREGAGRSTQTVADVLSRDDVERWVHGLASMQHARREAVERLTSSEAYSRLVAHVVYQGVKSFMLTENVLAKRIPGASSLVRLGQRGLGAAAPGLEQNVDRQIIAFVDASISDTIRDSRRFIDAMVDDESVSSLVEGAWAAAQRAEVSAAAELMTDEELDTVARLLWDQWVQLRDTDLAREVLSSVITEFLAANGQRPVADLLAGAGVTPDAVVAAVLPIARSVVAQADGSGHLEQRVRTRLSAFYDSYEE